MKRALILEDDELRGRALQRFLKRDGFEVVWAKNLAEAVELLGGPRFTLATIDYYLGPTDPVGAGITVARHIADMPADQRPEVIHIHSADHDGAEAMLEILRAAGAHAIRKELA